MYCPRATRAVCFLFFVYHKIFSFQCLPIFFLNRILTTTLVYKNRRKTFCFQRARLYRRAEREEADIFRKNGGRLGEN